MRPCADYAEPSSKDDIQRTEQILDESGRISDSIALISALIRSEVQLNVIRGVDRLGAFPTTDLSKEDSQLLAFLHVLALYRLKRDKEAIAVASEAREKKIAIPQTLQLLNELESFQDDKLAAAIGIGTAVVGIGAFALAWILRRKRS
jgi:fatty acid-binding protein DegV